MDKPLFIRDAGSRAGVGATYLDLGNDDWHALRITEQGWEVEELRPFLAVQNDDEFVLTVAFLVAAHRRRSLDRCRGTRAVTAVTVTEGSRLSSLGNEILATRFLHFFGERGTRSSYSSPRNHPERGARGQ